MRVIEADNFLSALAALALDPDQFFRVDVIPIVRGIIARVSTAGNSRHSFRAIVSKATEQHSATFVGISFLAVLTKRLVIRAR
jgi:hypothetical protein